MDLYEFLYYPICLRVRYYMNFNRIIYGFMVNPIWKYYGPVWFSICSYMKEGMSLYEFLYVPYYYLYDPVWPLYMFLHDLMYDLVWKRLCSYMNFVYGLVWIHISPYVTLHGYKYVLIWPIVGSYMNQHLNVATIIYNRSKFQNYNLKTYNTIKLSICIHNTQMELSKCNWTILFVKILLITT